jgi:hypothetical protein
LPFWGKKIADGQGATPGNLHRPTAPKMDSYINLKKAGFSGAALNTPFYFLQLYFNRLLNLIQQDWSLAYQKTQS